MLCRKLTDTPFPFPWVQAVNIALLLFTLLAPLAVVGFIENAIMATALTFMAVATHVTLNEVASDIEDPFHYDPNELPLPQVPRPSSARLSTPWHPSQRSPGCCAVRACRARPHRVAASSCSMHCCVPCLRSPTAASCGRLFPLRGDSLCRLRHTAAISVLVSNKVIQQVSVAGVRRAAGMRTDAARPGMEHGDGVVGWCQCSTSAYSAKQLPVMSWLGHSAASLLLACPAGRRADS